MPFHFKRKESVKKAVRRLCGERLGDALECLDHRTEFQAVHGVRKEIKKLRAILRLTRGEIGEKTYRKHTAALREAANLLTAFRDAQVTLKAFEDLMERFRRRLPARPFPGIRDALRVSCRAEEKKLGHSLAALREILRESKEELDRLNLRAKGWRAIGPGLKKAYRRGQEAFETAGRAPSEEHFHEWRKRVKDLWHQLCLLSPVRPRKLESWARKLDRLAGLLGDDHDLFMLREFVAKKFKPSPEARALESLIAARQQKLRTAALKRGRACYSRKPGRFCRQLEVDWKSWKRKG